MLAAMASFALDTGLEFSNALTVVLVALAGDAVLGLLSGGLGQGLGPWRAVTALAVELDRRLNRANRSDRARKIRGSVVAVALAVAAVAAGFAVAALRRHLPHGSFVDLLILLTVITQAAIFRTLRLTARALDRNDADLRGVALSRMMRLAPRRATLSDQRPGNHAADEFALARCGIELAAVLFASRVVAPIFWYALLGLPALMVYVVLDRAAAVLAPVGDRVPPFAIAAGGLADALGYVPAVLAGFLICAAAFFTPGANPARAFALMCSGAGHLLGRPAEWSVAAVAGGLDLALFGPAPAAGAQNPALRPWVGTGRARVGAADLRRMAYLFAVACLLVAGAVAALFALATM